MNAGNRMIRRAAALILGLSVLIWFYALSQVLKAPIEQKRALDDWDNRPSAASPLVAAEAAAVKEPLSAMPAGADDSIPASSPQQKKSGDPLIGVLAFPDGKRVPLYQGVSAQQLQKGAGLDSNGAFPGEPGNSVISGHRDTVFRILSQTKPGDEIQVETGAGVIAYTVETTEIIKETGTYSFQEEENSVLRLITCYPFFYAGPAPERFIVTARLKAQKN